LAGISNYPFRQLCREFGADLTFTEMVSVDGIVHNNASTMRLLQFLPQEHPIGLQFFGSEPETFAEVLPQLEKLQPDVIDLNFGCPVRKVVVRGAGAALLNDLDRMAKIVETVKSKARLPVTAKIRTGWDGDHIVACEAAAVIESAGADAITVHARTRSQGYSGEANWDLIARVKEAVKIPVIGNGDVFDGKSALSMFRETGADGIMIGRGALGRPWIFREIQAFLKEGVTLPEPTVAERIELISKHYQSEILECGAKTAFSRMKKHFIWYTRSLPYIASLRNRVFKAKSFSEVKSMFQDYRERHAVHFSA
jgi:tRNA-dihydrouridine synthase B